MKASNFRHWLQHMWHDHQTEYEGYGQPLSYSIKEYFARYKYWLKREYRHQQGVK
jgi:hypothetical protein